MKYIFYLLTIISLFSCSENRVTLNDLSETGGEFYLDGKKYTGIGFEMFDSKHIKLETKFKDGQKFGEERLFSENGDLIILKTYKSNILNGPYEEYYQSYDGTTKGPVLLYVKGSYIDDLKEGEFIECIDCLYDITTSDNKSKIEKLYVKGVYKKGFRTGKFQYYTKSNPSFSTVIYNEKGKVIDGVEINSSNYDLYMESRIIK